MTRSVTPWCGFAMVGLVLQSLCIAGSQAWSGSGNFTCAYNCTCNNATRTAYCDGVGLQGVPSEHELPNNTEIIYARDNDIESLWFLQFFSLRELYLKNNRVSGVGVKAFLETPILAVLDLDHNDLGAAKQDWQLFYELAALKKLRLSNNGFTKLHKVVFAYSHFPVLEELDLSHNRLEVIEENTFAELSVLRVLSLQHNKLKSLSARSFVGLVNLRKLDLSFNNLETFVNGSLAPVGSNASNIQLDLSYNSIENMEPNVFNASQSIRKLNAGYNRLTEVPYAAISRASTLWELVLDGNLLVELSPPSGGLLTNNVATLNLCNMPDLKRINIDALIAFWNLRTLRVENNPRLEFVHEEALISHNWHLLTHASLANNSLQDIDSDLLPWEHMERVDLSNNRWRCNCTLQWMRDTLWRPQFDESRNGTKCYYPESLRGRRVVDLGAFDFGCYSWLYYAVPAGVAFVVVVAVLSVLVYRKRHSLCRGGGAYTSFATNSDHRLQDDI